MIDHVSLEVGDYERSKMFYAEARRPLGYEVAMEFDGNVAGFASQGKPDFWLIGGTGPGTTHIAFASPDRDRSTSSTTTPLTPTFRTGTTSRQSATHLSRAPDAETGALRGSAMRQALHVTNGDSAAGTLVETTLVERVLPWRDALHEGPVPAVPADELRRVRADFLAEDEPSDREPIQHWLEERDRMLAANSDDAYVLWFEADLYDQLQVIQVLARLGELDVDPGRITLICIGEYLGIAHFGGLGELDAAQLERVAAAAARELSRPAIDLATLAWSAFRADDPRGLATIAKTQHPDLRFLAEAFDRLSREYPSTRDGLSLTERRVLAAVAERDSTAGDAFTKLGAHETRPFLGDSFYFRIVSRLANARTPLLEAEGPHVAASTRLRLTPAGRRVLDGKDDHIRLNGIDRWIGGVHLAGDEARWRWNEGTETIVES